MHRKTLVLLTALLLLNLTPLPVLAAGETGFVPLWSPEGDLVLLADSISNGTFWLVNVRSRTWRKASLSFYPSATRWSPDGKILAYASAGQVAFLNPVSLENHIEKPFHAASADARGLSWSPDGTRIAILYLSPGPAVQVVGTNGTSASPAVLTLPEGAGSEARLIWAPDGQHLALVSQGGAWVTNLSPGLHPAVWTNLIQDEAVVTDLFWAPDSRRLILSAATDLFGQNMDLVLTTPDASFWKPVLSGKALHPVAWTPAGDSLLCADVEDGRAGILSGLTSSGQAKIEWMSGIVIRKSTLPAGDTLAALVLTPEANFATQSIWERLGLDKTTLARNPRESIHWGADPVGPAENSLPIHSVEEVWTFRGNPGQIERLLRTATQRTSALSPDGRFLAASGSGNTAAQILSADRIMGLPAAGHEGSEGGTSSFLSRPATWFLILVLLTAGGSLLTLRLRRKKLLHHR